MRHPPLLCHLIAGFGLAAVASAALPADEARLDAMAGRIDVGDLSATLAVVVGVPAAARMAAVFRAQ